MQVMGEETCLLFPSPPCWQLSVLGCCSPPSPFSYHLPLGGASPAAGQHCAEIGVEQRNYFKLVIAKLAISFYSQLRTAQRHLQWEARGSEICQKYIPWPQGSFRSQNISCPSKFRTANPALWLSKSCEVEVTCTSRWNIHFYHHFNRSSKMAIMETFPVLLGLEEESLLISRKPELNTILMERISEGFTKRRQILLGFCPVNIFYLFIFSFWEFFYRKGKKKRKEKQFLLQC